MSLKQSKLCYWTGDGMFMRHPGNCTELSGDCDVVLLYFLYSCVQAFRQTEQKTQMYFMCFRLNVGISGVNELCQFSWCQPAPTNFPSLIYLSFYCKIDLALSLTLVDWTICHLTRETPRKSGIFYMNFNVLYCSRFYNDYLFASGPVDCSTHHVCFCLDCQKVDAITQDFNEG